MESLPILILILSLIVVLLFVGIFGGIIYDKVEENRYNQQVKEQEDGKLYLHNSYIDSYVVEEQFNVLKCDKYQMSKEDKKFRKIIEEEVKY